MKRIHQFWRSSLIGKIALGGVGFLAFCCLCSIPLAIASPSAPTAVPTETALARTATQILATETALPTFTSIPTNTSEPLATATTVPVPTTALDRTAAGASCIPNNPAETGKVVDTVDGDTIKVLLDQDGKTYTVRYIGMDTPESTTHVEYFGAQASEANAQIVYGKSVTLVKDVSETDRYGRLLRYVLADGLFINYELVVRGYATTASFPPDVACIPAFQAAEQQARNANLGLWNVPPTLVAVVPTLSIPNSGGSAACNCSGPDLDCKANFSTHAEAQACYNYCVAQGFGDVFRLDGNDNDGLACESLP